MIKHVIMGVAAATLYSFTAEAENATITNHFKTVINKKPYNVEVCVDQPTSGDKTADTLKGAIIGGIIGNNIKGENNGGALGAIVGGMLGHSNSSASAGTKRVCNVETRYNEEEITIYSHSTITFKYEGKIYNVKFKR